MRQALQLIFGLIVFLGTGELMVRIDHATGFFGNSRTEAVANTPRLTPDVVLLQEGQSIEKKASEVRILVIGDSKLRGIGVDPAAIVSVQLQRELSQRFDPAAVQPRVLDLSRPGLNTLSKKQIFLKYREAYRPDIVLIGYNLDDVYGNNEERQPRGDNPAPAPVSSQSRPGPVRSASSADSTRDLARRLKDVLFNSAVVGFTISKSNMELKLAGLVIPGTEFDHLIHQSHREDFRGWVLSRRHLSEVFEICRQSGIVPVVYLTPYLEMLEHYSLFSSANAQAMRFFEEQGVQVIDGVLPFAGSASTAWAISRYDGHPNEKAHGEMASQMASALEPVVRRIAR